MLAAIIPKLNTSVLLMAPSRFSPSLSLCTGESIYIYIYIICTQIRICIVIMFIPPSRVPATEYASLSTVRKGNSLRYKSGSLKAKRRELERQEAPRLI